MIYNIKDYEYLRDKIREEKIREGRMIAGSQTEPVILKFNLLKYPLIKKLAESYSDSITKYLSDLENQLNDKDVS